jgi:hypothetical protein
MTTTPPNLPVPITTVFPSPPRTTGNLQQDLGLLINWFQTAYLVIQQSIAYINSQVTNPAFSEANLPSPTNTTLAQAQTTANNAYNLANTANVEATNNANAITTIEGEITTIDGTLTTQAVEISNNTNAIAAQATLWNDLISGTVTFGATDTTKTITFGAAQADTNYRVMVNAISSTGTPAVGAYVVIAKTYTLNNFTVTIFVAPGTSNSVTFDWQLIRET